MKKGARLSAIRWQELSPQPIIGVDEVGRGCLAGPVYAAAVILNPEKKFKSYTDSKLLSEDRREVLAQEIRDAHRFGIGFATVEEIDQLNIFYASLLAMKRAVESLGVRRGHILVDGKFRIKDLKGFRQTPVVKGDLRCKPISAASILAKVVRDQLMKTLHLEFPQYAFEKHKGYATAEHRELIRVHKPCILHRRGFAGVKEYFLPELDPEGATPGVASGRSPHETGLRLDLPK